MKQRILSILLVIVLTSPSVVIAQSSSQNSLDVFPTSLAKPISTLQPVENFPRVESSDHLSEVLFSASLYHPRLKELRSSVKVAQQDIYQARSSYFPTVSVDALGSISRRSATLRNDAKFNQNTTPKNFSVNIDQTIYNGGRRALSLKNSALSTNVAEANFKIAQIIIATEVIEDYISLIAAETEAEFLMETVQVLENLALSVTKRRELEDATVIEVSQANSRLASARARRQRAVIEMSNARSRLQSKTGILVQNPSLPPAAYNAINQSLDEILLRARIHDPTLKQTKTQESIALNNIHIEKSRRLPTVSLSANATSTRDISPTLPGEDDLNIGVRITMPLYSGGSRKAQTRKAIFQHQAARHSNSEAERRVDLQILQLWTRIQGIKPSIEAQRESLYAAEVALLGTMQSKIAGITSTQDVLDATEAKLEAQISLSQSELSLNALRLILMLLTGQLNAFGDKQNVHQP